MSQLLPDVERATKYFSK